MEDLAKTVPAQKIGSADDFGKIAAFYVLNKQTSLPERNTSSGRNLWGVAITTTAVRPALKDTIG